MALSKKVKEILSWYGSENVGVKTNLSRMLMHGRLAGSGKLVILPVDQGFEHGPDRSFAMNLDAYDPEYHFNLAISAQLSAYAAPLGMLSSAADKFAGSVPLILKLNSANSLTSKDVSPFSPITATIEEALQLGCCAIGLTIYPGSNKFSQQILEAKEIIARAKSYGLAVVIWSYPRGEGVSKEGETAIDVCCYAGHIAALLGGHIIKLKPPSNFIEKPEALKIYQENNIATSTLSQRVSHVMRSCFNGKRLVVFSGLAAKSEDELLQEVQEIEQGGGSGSIIGRNSFQRPFANSVELLQKICLIYKK